MRWPELLIDRQAGSAHSRAGILLLTLASLLATSAMLAASSAVEAVEQKSQLRQSVKQYEAEIERLMAETGAYDMQLSEAYLGLGTAQQQQNDHSNAVKTFKKAVQIQRVNTGLFSTDALPIIEKMIDSHIALREWDEVDDNYHLLLSTSGRSFGRGDPRIIPLLKKASAWHMYAFQNRLGDNPISHLNTARSLFAYGAELTIDNYGAGDPSVSKLLRSQLVTEYYMARLALDVQSQQALIASTDHSRDLSQTTRPLVYNRINNVGNMHGYGLRTIDKMLKLYENNEQAPPGAYPLALVDLGDWYMLFNKRRSGLKAYQQAWSIFSADPGLSTTAQEVFAKPTRLPEFEKVLEEDAPDSPEGEHVLLSMDVTQAGSVRRVSVLQSEPTQEDAVNRAVRELRSMRFRPAFVDGQPVEYEGLKFRYFYSYRSPQSAAPGQAEPVDKASETVSAPAELPAEGVEDGTEEGAENE